MLQETGAGGKGSTGQAVVRAGVSPEPFSWRASCFGSGHESNKEGLVDLIVTLIIGGVVGWLASILMKTNAQMGILANVLIGIVGSFIGHAIANSLHLG